MHDKTQSTDIRATTQLLVCIPPLCSQVERIMTVQTRNPVHVWQRWRPQGVRECLSQQVCVYMTTHTYMCLRVHLLHSQLCNV